MSQKLRTTGIGRAQIATPRLSELAVQLDCHQAGLAEQALAFVSNQRISKSVGHAGCISPVSALAAIAMRAASGCDVYCLLYELNR